jgi:hypothetical protein
LNKPAKLKATFLLTLMISMSLLLILNSTIAMAQTNQAEVLIVNSVGGTTDPPASTTSYFYNSDDIINLTATAGDGFTFQYWIFQVLYTSGTNQPPVVVPAEGEAPFPNLPASTQLAQDVGTLTQNPLHLICGYGYTILYQAVFAPITSTVPGQGLASNAIVNVLVSTGGTTSPKAGTYTYGNGSAINLKATANDGFEFKYWIITASYIVGANQPQIVIPGEGEEPWPQLPNPADVASVNVVDANSALQVLCGYGYTVNYQAVFAPTGSGVTPPGGTSGGIPVEYLYAAIAVIAIVAVIAIALAMMYMKRSKTPK